MTNRINGDFDQESIEAFRSAYAAQILEPEDLETDPYTGLPTNLVLNTSPWIQHTGLWKANDGTDKNFVPNQVLVQGAYEEVSEGAEEAEEDGEDITEEELNAILQSFEDNSFEDEEDEGALTDEEIESLIEELLSEAEESEEEQYEPEEESEESEEEISEEEIDALIAELEAELD